MLALNTKNVIKLIIITYNTKLLDSTRHVVENYSS